MYKLIKLTTLMFIICSSSLVFGQYEIKSEEGYSYQIGIMVNMLEDLKNRITEEVDSLTIEQTDFLFDENANRIGALILHLAATEYYYQVETLEERSWTEEESMFWETPSSLGASTREKFKGKPIQYYLNIWNEVREKTLTGLEFKDDNWFQSEVDDNVNYHWVWYHVMEHQANHMGQIALIKNRLPKKVEYRTYHSHVVTAETYIASENYADALEVYNGLFEKYEFVFLRDYQIATQLALFLEKEQEATRLLIEGIKSGWTEKSINKNNFLDQFRKSGSWKTIQKEYPRLHDTFMSSLDLTLRNRVMEMYKKDQKKAIGALFKLSSKAQDKYAETKFAPHSEKQINEVIDILSKSGYPGEKFIGTEIWMSTILSHHNSISKEYNKKDTLYLSLKPKLMLALQKGEISAFSYVMIEEWYRSVVEDDDLPTYGILDGPLQQDLASTNELRAASYIRSIDVHNKLVEIEEKTGMNFYLGGHPWDKGKIEIK